MTADPFAHAREYLARVLPWPEQPGQAYVNVHWTFQGQNFEKPAWTGRAVSSVAEAINAVQFALKGANTRDIYVCLSTQRECEEKVSGKGHKYRAPIRNQENVAALKAIWLDLDAKGEDKNSYASLEDAAVALADFIRAVGLPRPSIVVGSGGGLHVYWVMSRALTVDEWKPLAFALAEATKRHGLKCDTQCTIDSARVLRIPNTLNRKTERPRPVKIAGTATDFDYNVERLEQALAPYKVAIPAALPAASFLENPALFPPRTPVNDNELGAGIDISKRTAVDLDSVAKECAFIHDAITSGGKDYTNPLWNLTTLIAVFAKGGRADAHRMGDKHPGYTKESTDELFDRKEREKAQKGLGWPSCQTISGSGCTACQACPHFAAGKSPLNLAGHVLPSQVTASVCPTTFPDPWAEFVGPPFPLEILAPPLANFVDAEHRAMGADVSALAMASLTAVAGAIHAETRVRMGSGWSERPLLWTALVGSPSSMKSPVIEKATAPLRKIDHDGDTRWRQLYGRWKQSKSAGTNPGPSPAKPARQIIQDGTPEKIAELLARSDSGSLMVHDELAGHLASFDRYGSGPAARSFFLSCWNGGPYLKDRVGQGARDENAEIRVENLALGVLGGIQPDRLAQIKDLTSDGLLQRYFLVAMRSPVRGDEYHSVNTAENEYAKLVQNLHLAPPRQYEFGLEAAVVRRRVLDRLFWLEQLQGFPDALIGAIGKMRGYYGRLALILHLANECAANPNGPALAFSTDIPKDTAEAAEKLLFQFLLPHVFGVYDVISSGGKHRDMIRAIAGFILADDKDRIRPSDLTAGVRKLRHDSQKEIAEFASRFCALGWLRPEDDNTPMPKAWLVVSGLREHFAERRKQVQQARAEAHAILSAGGKRA